MDRIDVMLEEFFAPEAPRDLASRLLGGLRAKRVELEALADRFRIEATERGVARLRPGRGDHGASARARAHAERARQELREYLAGRRTFFTVAVDNALGANPVPVIVPCHRIIRGDGTWGHYAFGGEMKTRLLRLERSTPALIGCTSTRIVCRRGCAHEQRVTEANRVVFASVADAASVGYRPCRVCRPSSRG